MQHTCKDTSLYAMPTWNIEETGIIFYLYMNKLLNQRQDMLRYNV